MIEASATRRPARPRTRSRGSTTASGRRPGPSGRCRRGGRWSCRCRRPPRASSASVCMVGAGQVLLGREAAPAPGRRRCGGSGGWRRPRRAGPRRSPGSSAGSRAARSGRRSSSRTRAAAGRPQVADRGGEGRERVQRLAELVEATAAGRGTRGSAWRSSGRCGRRRRAASGAMVSGPVRDSSVFDAPSAALPSRRPAMLVQRPHAPDLVDQPELQVVLQVLADARQLVRGPRCRAPAGAPPAPMPESLEQVRRADRARGQDHLAPRRAPRRSPAARGRRRRRSGAPRARAPVTWAPVTTAQVGPPQRRPQEALGGRPAHAAALVDLEVAAALVVAAVEVVDLGDAALRPRPRGRRRGSPSAAAAARPATRRRRRGARRRPASGPRSA